LELAANLPAGSFWKELLEDAQAVCQMTNLYPEVVDRFGVSTLRRITNLPSHPLEKRLGLGIDVFFDREEL
jgi:hypothetical protein